MTAGKGSLVIIVGAFAVVGLAIMAAPDGGPAPAARPNRASAVPVQNGMRLVGFDTSTPTCVDTRPEIPNASALIASLTPAQRKQAERIAAKSIKDDCDAAYADYFQPMAARACERMVRTGLNDPDSAKFPDYADIEVTTRNRTIYRARMQFRAKNAFNAYVLTGAECQLRRDVESQKIVPVSYKLL